MVMVNNVCISIFSPPLPSPSLQSKEIAFQLQEDLMKVLNELYTVSAGILFLPQTYPHPSLKVLLCPDPLHLAQILIPTPSLQSASPLLELFFHTGALKRGLCHCAHSLVGLFVSVGEHLLLFVSICWLDWQWEALSQIDHALHTQSSFSPTGSTMRASAGGRLAPVIIVWKARSPASFQFHATWTHVVAGVYCKD